MENRRLIAESLQPARVLIGLEPGNPPRHDRAMLDGASQEAKPARRTHSPATVKSFVPRYNSLLGTLMDSAIRWLLPWEAREYPGLTRGSEQALPYLSRHTVMHYRKGSRRLPPDVAADLADQIEARCRAGMEVVKLLRVEAQGPARLTPLGFREVKDWDGSGVMTDARGKRRRAKKV